MSNPNDNENTGASGVASSDLLDALVEEVPTTWLDPLLTGKDAVIPSVEKRAIEHRDVAILLSALKERMQARAKQLLSSN